MAAENTPLNVQNEKNSDKRKGTKQILHGNYYLHRPNYGVIPSNNIINNNFHHMDGAPDPKDKPKYSAVRIDPL